MERSPSIYPHIEALKQSRADHEAILNDKMQMVQMAVQDAKQLQANIEMIDEVLKKLEA